MSIEAPFAQHEEPVRPEWIDDSGHMNVGFYLLAFENATRAFFQHLDLSRAYRERSGCALFAAEAHLGFERELRAGTRLRFTTQLLGFAPRWLHCFHTLYEADRDRLAATNELLFVHVDLGSRRAVPLSPAHQRALAEIERAHATLGRPPQAGRAIRPGSAGPPATS